MSSERSARLRFGVSAFGLMSGALMSGVLMSGAALVAMPAQAQDGASAGTSGGDAAAPAPGSVDARTMDINEYFVEGNTLLSDDEIERAVYPFLGPKRVMDDVEGARAALQKAYEAKGYKAVFVEIPQQNVVGGRIRLSVSQARTGTVAVSGAKRTSQAQLLKALPSIAPGTVPNLDRFSAELAAVNSQSADRQVTPELKAGAEPGTLDIALNVEDKSALHGGIELSNRYSRDTTKSRLQANLSYDDLWGRGHSVSAFYAVAPERPDDSEVYVVSYGAPLPHEMRLDVTGLVSNSEVATVADTDVLGDGQSLTAVLSKTLPSSGGLYHRATLSVAYKNFKENVTFGDVTDKSPIGYYPISLGYAGSLAREKSDLTFNAALTFSLRDMGSTPEDFDYKRYRATGGFTYLRLSGSYRHDLPKGAEIFASLDGQVASEPLVSNEQFAAGGAGSVRGYLQSAAIGDDGLASTVEWRSKRFRSKSGNNDVRAILFADAATVWIESPLPEQDNNQSLFSVGAGLRLRLLDRINGDIDLGVPLTGLGETRAGDALLHLRLSTDF